MFKTYILAKPWLIVSANSNDAFVPEIWAQESLMVLEANLVAANLVHRDFEDEIARAGDIVNTRRPAAFTAKRKVDGDAVTTQDATATNVAVPLDQHLHTTFIIYDGEESKGFKSLRDEYLVPALQSIAQALDRIVLNQTYGFLTNVVGALGTDPGKATVIAAREKLNDNKAPFEGRNLIVTPGMEGALLNVADFVNAEKTGDAGTALREGSLGKKFGFSVFMDQNAPAPVLSSAVRTGAINKSAGEAAGALAVDCDGITGAAVAGSWFTIAGDMIPHKVVSSTGGSTPTNIVFTPALASAVVNDAVITIYTPGACNVTAGLDAGWNKAIVVDGFGGGAAKTGQMISCGSVNYGLMETPTATSLLFDRSLAAAMTNDDVLGVGPVGDYGLAFHRNAIALVTRPLAAPAPGSGAKSYVANYKGLSIRITITYDGQYQGHRVTADLLAGVKVLDTNLGCVVLG
jgi:hypothetical protein